MEALEGCDAFFLIRPQESWGTRIGRQPEGPGPVIQDPGDGEHAVVWTYEEEGKPPVSVDYGLYDSDEALEAAIATAAGLPMVAACDGRAGGCTGGGGGGGTDSVPSTHLTQFVLKVHGDGVGAAEVEITVGYWLQGTHIRGTRRETGVTKNVPRDVNRVIVAGVPRPGGVLFYARASETDFWRDDNLGFQRFGYSEGGTVLNLDKIDISLSW